MHLNFFKGKNSLINKKIPEKIIKNIYELSVSQYSNVRSYSQKILCKIATAMEEFETQEILIPLLVKSLQPGVSHQEFKGALYIITQKCFFDSWKNTSILYPALVKAQHSDKESIVVLLKDISSRCNRDHPDFIWWTLPIKFARISENALQYLELQLGK